MSPDGYLQMAMQLACFRMGGAAVAAVAAVSTRKFLQGRADLIRVTTPESVSFCQVFESSRSSRAEKEASLRKAVARYKEDALLAGNGLAVGRITLGLMLTAIENEIPLHPFFRDRGLEVFWNPRLVTSQMSSTSDIIPCADPMIPDGYNVTYNTQTDAFIFSVTRSNSNATMSAIGFKQAIEKSLSDIRKCVPRPQNV